jgi:hypothetical protein
LRKATLALRHDRPSAWNNSAPTGRILIKLDIWAVFKNLSRKFTFIKIRQEYFTWRRFHIYDNIWLVIWRIRITCWISKATCTHTHTQICNTYCFSATTIIRERAWLLRYTYIACLVFSWFGPSVLPHRLLTSAVPFADCYPLYKYLSRDAVYFLLCVTFGLCLACTFITCQWLFLCCKALHVCPPKCCGVILVTWDSPVFKLMF